MLFGDEPRRKERCLPLGSKGPPGPEVPCKPTLLLGLSEWTVQSLDHVLMHDLVFGRYRCCSDDNDDDSNSSNTAPVSFLSFAPEIQTYLYRFFDSSSLVNVSKAFGGGSAIVSLDMESDDGGGGDWEDYLSRTSDLLAQLAQQNKQYQAIVVDDSSFLRDPSVARFVTEQYHDKNTSVVIIGVEGIFNLEPLRTAFGVNWRATAYTSRDVMLNEAGRQIIGREGFAMDKQYVKALFVEGDQELFAEHIGPTDYDYDSEGEETGLRAPQPGSPVVTYCENEHKSVSYFGFMNDLDVSFGAIILRLCYAAQHRQLSSS